ncbi:MAG: HAMP domain-containing histidine kinase, partial [bacterium]|nr:HAMP domain-containing histidine kinase [bacterium]
NLSLMLRNSQSLLTLINQLLELSRFDSGKMRFQAANQDIIPFLKGILESFQVPADKKKQLRTFHTKIESLLLYFDAQKMEEAINNLLMNAVKFTHPGGKITLSVSVTTLRNGVEEQKTPVNVLNWEKSPGGVSTEEVLAEDFLKLSVRDTGDGMSTEQLALIFNRFYQVGSSGKKGHKGSGIGLAITKEIVTLHHGRINVHSQEGKGTEFVILLPMGKDHLKPSEIAPSPAAAFRQEESKVEIKRQYSQQVEKAGSGETNRETAGDCDTNTPAETGKETETGAVTGTGKMPVEPEKDVVLVVEDNDDVRNYIKGPLQLLYTVE